MNGKTQLLYSKWRMVFLRLAAIKEIKPCVQVIKSKLDKGEHTASCQWQTSPCCLEQKFWDIQQQVRITFCVRHSIFQTKQMSLVLFFFFFLNFKAFWLKYSRRALTEQAVSVLVRKASMAAVHSLNLFTSRLEWNKHDRWFFKKIKGEVLGTQPSK